MQVDGIDISAHTSNNTNEYKEIDFDYVITVCNAKEGYPYFPSKAKKFHYNFPDPVKASGTEEQAMQLFRHMRDMIKQYCKDFVADNF